MSLENDVNARWMCWKTMFLEVLDTHSALFEQSGRETKKLVSPGEILRLSKE